MLVKIMKDTSEYIEKMILPPKNNVRFISYFPISQSIQFNPEWGPRWHKIIKKHKNYVFIKNHKIAEYVPQA